MEAKQWLKYITFEPKLEEMYFLTCALNEDSNPLVFVVRIQKLCVDTRAKLNLSWAHMFEDTTADLAALISVI